MLVLDIYEIGSTRPKCAWEHDMLKRLILC